MILSLENWNRFYAKTFEGRTCDLISKRSFFKRHKYQTPFIVPCYWLNNFNLFFFSFGVHLPLHEVLNHKNYTQTFNDTLGCNEMNFCDVVFLSTNALFLFSSGLETKNMTTFCVFLRISVMKGTFYRLKLREGEIWAKKPYKWDPS